MRRQAAAIIRKEFIEMRRALWYLPLVAVAFTGFLQWFIVGEFSRGIKAGRFPLLATAEGLSLAVTLSLVYVSPMIGPFFCSGAFARTLARERLLGTLMPLLATGVRPGVVWGAKVFAVFTASQAVAVVCVVVNILVIRFVHGLKVAWSVPLCVFLLVIGPLIALALVALMSFIYWTTKAVNVLGAIVPSLLMLGLFNALFRYPTTRLLLREAAVIGVGAVLLVVVLGMVGNKLSRQYVAGL